MFFLETQNQTEVVFFFSVEPSNDTRQGLEATEKEFIGVETNRDESRQGSCFRVSNNTYLPCEEPTNEAIRKGKCLEANETTIKEENITTSENRFVTLILTTNKLVSSTTKLLCVFSFNFFTCYKLKSKE